MAERAATNATGANAASVAGVRRKSQAMYGCCACKSIFIVAMCFAPESMPCFPRARHCPFCPSDLELQLIAETLPDLRERNRLCGD